MSAKVLFPLSALAACPLTLLAAYSKAPDEAADLAIVETPQQSSAKSFINAARLSATVRPDLPLPFPERLQPPVKTAYIAAIPNPLAERRQPEQTRTPTINLGQTQNASLQRIIARSVAPAQSLNNRHLAVKSPTATVASAPRTTVASIAVLPSEALPQTPEAAVALETNIAAVPTPIRSPAEIPQPSGFSSSSQVTSSNSDSILIIEAESVSTTHVISSNESLASQPKLTKQKAHPFMSERLLPATTSPHPEAQHLSTPVSPAPVSSALVSSASISIDAPPPLADPSPPNRSVQVAMPIAIEPERSIQTPERSMQVFPPRATPIAQVAPAPVTSTPAVSTQVASPQPNIIGETYTLGGGDRVNVNFFSVPEYSGEYQIATDGSVNLPVVGGISLAGLTLQEASNFIASLYQNELAHPRVTVNVTGRRPLQVSIIGEVGQPGLYTLGADQNAQVIQAIQTAGGLTQSANLRQVQIRRSFRGQTQTIAVNVRSLLENGDLTQNLTLQDGDSLYIPATDTFDLAESEQLASSNLASTTTTQLKIALVGEVNRPGAYQFPSAAGARTTLTQAIQGAGGITPTADIRQVQIRRMTRMGETQTVNVDLRQLIQSGDLNQDLILQDGDTIVLAKAEQLTPAESIQLASTNLSPAAIQVSLMGEVESPGSVQLSSTITLNQALLQAGGLNSRAKRSAQLVRVNPNGTLTRRTIDLDFDRDADAELNPVLQNNDVVVVGRSRITQIADGVSNVTAPIFRILAPLQLLFGL